MTININKRYNWSYIYNLTDFDTIFEITNLLSYDFIKEGILAQYKSKKFTDTKKKEKQERLKDWDGKKVFLREYRNGFRIRTGLLDNVLSILDDFDLDVKINDLRKKPKRTIKYNHNIPQLWDHQEKALQKILDYESGMIHIGTGGGKTNLIAELIYRRGLETIIFYDSLDSAYQTYYDLQKMLGKNNVGFIGDSKDETFIKQGVNIILVQTGYSALRTEGYIKKWNIEVDSKGRKIYNLELLNFSRKEYPLICDTILGAEETIVDEIDRILGPKTYSMVLEQPKSYYNLGLSGTTWRNDGKDLEMIAGTGNFIYQISTTDLIYKGILSPLDIYFINVPKHISKIPYTYKGIYRICLIENSLQNTIGINNIKYLNDKGQIGIAHVSQVKHGKLLGNLAEDKGLDFKEVYGKQDQDQRAKAVKDLINGKIQLIISTLFGRGFNCPELEFWARFEGLGMSYTSKPNNELLQQAGRLTRKHPNKKIKRKILIDFWNNFPYLKDHSIARKKGYEFEKGFTVKRVIGLKNNDQNKDKKT